MHRQSPAAQVAVTPVLVDPPDVYAAVLELPWQFPRDGELPAAHEQSLAAARAATDRLELLQRVTAALAATHTRDTAAQAVLDDVASALEASIGSLSLLTDDGEAFEVLGIVNGRRDVVEAWQRFPRDLRTPNAVAVDSDAPILVFHRAEIRERFPIIAPTLESLEIVSIWCVPVRAGDRVLGVMDLCFETHRDPWAETSTMLSAVARQCAQALERARLFDAERAARSEAEAARAVAEAANKAKSEFLAVMSHELRTPLNAIGGYVELIELGIRGPVTAEQRVDLARIQRSQRHLLGLINGVLNYSRVEAGAISYELTRIALSAVLEDCETLVAPQMQSKGIDFSVHECHPGIWVHGDDEKVQQILINLLSNAIKFTPAGGSVRVSCGEQTDGPTPLGYVTVHDTGPGIADLDLERIFQPFVQVDSGLTRAGNGVGLGLAISRDLARGMGGELRVQSLPAGGSEFTLTLPRAD